MNLKQIEARIAKLEAAHKASRYDRWTEAELDHALQQRIDDLIGSDGSFADLIAEIEAFEDLQFRESARLTVKFFGERYGYPVPAST